MKKRIAIPLESGMLCAHFGHCQQFAIIDTNENLITGETLVTPPPHEPGLLPAWLAEKGVTDVIAGGMGQRAISLFNQQKINVFVGAPIKSPKELTSDLLTDSLEAGANYCDHWQMISFGPVPSRRLGKSLGVNNIISPKVCSYGCIYCQVGKTTRKSIKRDTFFDPENIYKNVIQHINRLTADNYPDYLTIVSNGEPTLDKNLGRSIMLLKKTGIPVAVITNASLLIYDSVKEDLDQADWVSLKMDAGTGKTWNLINRPAEGLDFEKHLENIIKFAANYKGLLRTESMLVDGINDSEEELQIIADIIKKINPGKAYLSVPVRPPAEKSVKVPEPEKLNRAWQIFTAENIKTELLTGFEGSDTGYTGNIYEDILNITAVHPLREDTLSKLLEKDNADYQVVESLINQKLIKSVLYKGKKFFLREYHINK